SMATSLVQKIMPGLREQVESVRVASIAKFLTEPGMLGWTGDMNALQKAADDPANEKILARQAAQDAADLQANKAKGDQLRAAAEQAKAELPDLQKQLAAKRTEVDGREHDIQSLEGRKSAAVERKKAAEARRDAELRRKDALSRK